MFGRGALMNVAELRGEVDALSNRLGVSTDTEGLTRRQLEAIVEDMRAKLSPTETASTAIDDPPVKEPDHGGSGPNAGVDAVTYLVAPGKALVTAGGVAVGGDEVTARSISRSQDDTEECIATLRDLASRGYLVER